MTRIRLLTTSLIATSIVFSSMTSASAWDKKNKGKYKSRHGSGTFETGTSGSGGQRERVTSWKGEHGQGTQKTNTNWNKENKSGTYHSQTTLQDRGAITSEGTVTREAPGQFKQEGVIRGSQGKEVQVERVIKRQESGSHTVQTTYTDAQGKTVTVNKTIQDGKVTGAYESSTGQSGQFQNQKSFEDGKWVNDGSLTTQSGKTWKKRTETSADKDGITRDVTVTDPQGKQDSWQDSVTPQ